MNEILKNREINNGTIELINLDFDDENKPLKVTDNYIDISYGSKETAARVLSNLYPYKFDYFGYSVSSIEAAIQSLKYKDENIRRFCFEYSAADAVHLRGLNPYDWQKEGILYTPIKSVDRFSEEYQQFLDELYFMAFQNLLYVNNLKNSKNKMLDHTIGENNRKFSTLTRTEYISRLYALRYCVHNEISAKGEVTTVLKKVREELH